MPTDLPEDFFADTKLDFFEDVPAQDRFAGKAAPHSEFLRTGRIDRSRPNWEPAERRYLSYEEVAERTGKYLTQAGSKTHERLNAFHPSIQFPRVIFHRTLQGKPHLGYCHVTASKSDFAEYKNVKWSFYIANFSAEISPGNLSFEKVDIRSERMYFAVAVEKSQESNKLEINTSVRGNGVLFQTSHPGQAMKNVLMMGAKREEQRRAIKAISLH